jgi:MoaA/NifB/PqqE/SkfB family radical SAM enzyme
MRVTEAFHRSRLPLDDVKRILDAAAERGVEVVSFTGGEPLLFPDELVQLIEYAGNAGIKYIRTGTNGFMFANSGASGFESRVRKLAESLAATPLRNFWISVDSAVPWIHEEMRGFPGLVAGIEKALPIFHECGVYPSANLGINRNIAGKHNVGKAPSPEGNESDRLRYFYDEMRDGFRSFYRFVIGLGFTIVNACYPMSVVANGNVAGLKSVYAATSEERIVRYTGAEKAMLFRALMETIPELRSQIRIFSPRVSLYSLGLHYAGHDSFLYPCRGGIDFFFVDSKDGNTYPCGYRGNENLGRFWNLELDKAPCPEECFQCDWECFRDPSELFGPFLEGLSSPLDLIGKFRRDSRYFDIWVDDLSYYRACDFFDGRKPPDFKRLRRFEARSNSASTARTERCE